MILTPVLTVETLTAAYRRVEVVHGVGFDAKSGRLLAILGANGAGKTSLLGAIAGLVSATGSLCVAGEECIRVPAYKRAHKGIALVPEVRGNLFPSMTVEENLQIAFRNLGRAEDDALRADLHAMFPILQERSLALAGMLSGGEQQMLAIAVALGRRPKVLLLDEPTQGLAPSVFDILQSAFAHLKTQGMAILLAEQNLSFAARCADEFIVLANGRISLRGAGADLHDPDRLMAAYLGQMPARDSMERVAHG